MTKFERVIKEHQKVRDEDFKLPLRATKNASGYDFYATQDLVIRPGEKVFFPTDVKAIMNEDETLLLDVRSSIGHKKDLMLTTTIGNVDTDFANNPENDGNIGIGLRNLKPSMTLEGYYPIQANLCAVNSEGNDLELNEHGQPILAENSIISVPIIKDLRVENTIFIAKGERVAQGIIVKYVKAENCNSDNERVGGFGSSGK